MTTEPKSIQPTFNAWHGSEDIKQNFVAAAIEHREADRYIQGTYARGAKGSFKACSVGCSLATVYDDLDADEHEHGDHQRLADELGVPLFITRMQDRIFEGLPKDDAIAWTERLFSAIPAGADLSRVQPRFLIAVQRRTLGLVDRETFPDVYDAIAGVIEVLDGWERTGEVDESAAWSARSAARSAAESARSARSAARSAAESARSAAESAAWSARSARSAAESAAWSARSARSVAESAARSAAESAARSAARSAAESAWSAAYQWMADTLIELIKDTPS